MLKTTNMNVIYSWDGGRPARSHNGNLYTDGENLFSYNLKIGITVRGEKIALDYTAPANSFRSMTTSNHVGKAKRHADTVMHPKVAQMSFRNNQ